MNEAYPHRSGWIEVVVGPMYSGKTEELIRRKHSDETIKLVLGGSFIRVLSELWK